MIDINALKLTREIREKQYSEIKNKSNQEIIQYFKNKANLLKKDFKTAGNLT